MYKESFHRTQHRLPSGTGQSPPAVGDCPAWAKPPCAPTCCDMLIQICTGYAVLKLIVHRPHMGRVKQELQAVVDCRDPAVHALPASARPATTQAVLTAPVAAATLQHPHTTALPPLQFDRAPDCVHSSLEQSQSLPGPDSLLSLASERPVIAQPYDALGLATQQACNPLQSLSTTLVSTSWPVPAAGHQPRAVTSASSTSSASGTQLSPAAMPALPAAAAHWHVSTHPSASSGNPFSEAASSTSGSLWPRPLAAASVAASTSSAWPIVSHGLQPTCALQHMWPGPGAAPMEAPGAFQQVPPPLPASSLDAWAPANLPPASHPRCAFLPVMLLPASSRAIPHESPSGV